MDYTVFGLSDVGKVREKNEDSILIDQDLNLMAVCDGMGGHAAGEIASRTACAAMAQFVAEHKAALDAYAQKPSAAGRASALKVCEDAVRHACREIYDLACRDAEARGMGTTAVLLILAGGNALVANVGDSRAYMTRFGRIFQMTEDHTISTESIRKGLMTPEEAGARSLRSVLSRSVGFQPSVQVDTLNFDIMPGDTLVLCTDGLTGHLENREILALVSRYPIEEAPKCLVDAANARGGKDNISCIVARIDGEPDPATLHADRKIEALRRLTLFSEVDYVDLIKILNILTVRNCKPGETIIREGEASDKLYVVISGEVAVSKCGKRLSRLRTGAFFGEMGLIDSSPRSADVIALEPSRLLVLPHKDFKALLDREPRMAIKVLWAFCDGLDKRLRSTSGDVVLGEASARTQELSDPDITGSD